MFIGVSSFQLVTIYSENGYREYIFTNSLNDIISFIENFHERKNNIVYALEINNGDNFYDCLGSKDFLIEQLNKILTI